MQGITNQLHETWTMFVFSWVSRPSSGLTQRFSAALVIKATLRLICSAAAKRSVWCGELDVHIHQASHEQVMHKS